jgi:hypothetical protein
MDAQRVTGPTASASGEPNDRAVRVPHFGGAAGHVCVEAALPQFPGNPFRIGGEGDLRRRAGRQRPDLDRLRRVAPVRPACIRCRRISACRRRTPAPRGCHWPAPPPRSCDPTAASRSRISRARSNAAIPAEYSVNSTNWSCGSRKLNRTFPARPFFDSVGVSPTAV